MKLSVVLATRNEASNIERCLKSVKDLADEIIVFDEYSSDNTKNIALKLGAKVYSVAHEANFHKTKQKAIDAANGDWILQMDADEVITQRLSKEIKEVINSTNEQLLNRIMPFNNIKNNNKSKIKLFKRHQVLIEKRDGRIGKRSGEVVAFFVPRLNMFLGKPLRYGGVYPDPAIRLIKKGKAWLPARDVHEIMEVEGEVGWLFNHMEHYDSPTFERYLGRNNRYTNLLAKDLKDQKLPVNTFTIFDYMVKRPFFTFLSLYFRHKSILDGLPGFVWAFFSALRFPIAYLKYWQEARKGI